MGLAASQSRFLGLTARKSNAEYRAQQINQQRTDLSNEVLGLYQEYNRLQVPVPPNEQDFVKTVYSIDTKNEKYQIENFTKILDGDYKDFYNVSLTYMEGIQKAYPYTAKDSIITRELSAGGYINNLSMVIDGETYLYEEGKEDNTITRIDKDHYGDYAELAKIMEEMGIDPASEPVFFMITMQGKNYYTTENDLKDVNYDSKYEEKDAYVGDYLFTYLGQTQTEKTINAIANLSQASDGRLTNIFIVDCEDDKDLIGASYPIDVGTHKDEMGFDDATNKYNYDLAVYQKEVERINKKTDTIQREDRALELQIRQIDTEQNALKTEMDSVKKVIEDTTEKVFKTFSS